MLGSSPSFLIASIAILVLAESGSAQVGYRNLDAGRPVRVEDAAPTERHALDLDLTTLRVDFLSHLRERVLIEPRMAYGILPNTEFSIRVPIFFRERSQSPRSGISGVGIGGKRELRLESRRLPAFGLAAETFLPVGPNATRPAFSAKALMTRSFPVGRLHLNASYGTFAVRLRPGLVITAVCGEPGLPPCPEAPIDHVCDLSAATGFPPVLAACASGARTLTTDASSAAVPGEVVRRSHWLIGVAGDKALPLRSTLLVADVFVEHFDGLRRSFDWTAEFGVRRQVSPRLVVDATVGRHYYGSELSSFIKFGTSFSRPVLVQRPR
jgi:hypothetical protein